MDKFKMSILEFRDKVLKKKIFTHFEIQKQYVVIWSQIGKYRKIGIADISYFVIPEGIHL